MNMKCRDLSTLRSFKKIRLIAGSGGLDHIITWVYINQDSSISDWIHGGELVFITGNGKRILRRNVVLFGA